MIFATPICLIIFVSNVFCRSWSIGSSLLKFLETHLLLQAYPKSYVPNGGGWARAFCLLSRFKNDFWLTSRFKKIHYFLIKILAKQIIFALMSSKKLRCARFNYFVNHVLHFYSLKVDNQTTINRCTQFIISFIV